MNRSRLAKVFVVVTACLTAGLVWTGVGRGATTPPQPAPSAPRVITAHFFAKVVGADPGVFGTGLEGAAFDSQGRFYFVNTTAPPVSRNS